MECSRINHLRTSLGLLGCSEPRQGRYMFPSVEVPNIRDKNEVWRSCGEIGDWSTTGRKQDLAFKVFLSCLFKQAPSPCGLNLKSTFWWNLPINNKTINIKIISKFKLQMWGSSCACKWTTEVSSDSHMSSKLHLFAILSLHLFAIAIWVDFSKSVSATLWHRRAFSCACTVSLTNEGLSSRIYTRPSQSRYFTWLADHMGQYCPPHPLGLTG